MTHRFIINDGQLVDIYDIATIDINMETIAHSLSNQCRYNGHTDTFYSVAQHCCLAHDYIDSMYQWFDPLAGLLHDAAEAFTGDIVRPVKHQFEDLKALEHEILDVILRHLGIPFLMDECESNDMYKIDMHLLATEKRDLFKNNLLDWPGLEEYAPFPDKIITWTPTEAKEQWLKRLTNNS